MEVRGRCWILHKMMIKELGGLSEYFSLCIIARRNGVHPGDVRGTLPLNGTPRWLHKCDYFDRWRNCVRHLYVFCCRKNFSLEKMLNHIWNKSTEKVRTREDLWSACNNVTSHIYFTGSVFSQFRQIFDYPVTWKSSLSAWCAYIDWRHFFIKGDFRQQNIVSVISTRIFFEHHEISPPPFQMSCFTKSQKLMSLMLVASAESVERATGGAPRVYRLSVGVWHV